jgi:hypothetical protein
MLIVNNPSVNAIDIVSAGRRLSIKPKQDGQKLNVSAEDAKAIKTRLSKSHPYLTFDQPQAQAQAEEPTQAQAEEQAQVKAEEPIQAQEEEPAQAEQEQTQVKAAPASKKGK